MDLQKDTVRPRYRFGLRGRIHMAGFRTLGEFSRAVGVDIARICCGWEWPSPWLHESIAKQLGLTIRELKELLYRYLRHT
jgi:hypothetical protein